jgi:hypothetical protein
MSITIPNSYGDVPKGTNGRQFHLISSKDTGAPFVLEPSQKQFKICKKWPRAMVGDVFLRSTSTVPPNSCGGVPEDMNGRLFRVVFNRVIGVPPVLGKNEKPSKTCGY